MSSFAYAASDAATMLRRNLMHVKSYPTVPLFVAGIPLIFLLLFVYVLGGTLGAGLGGGRSEYLAYLLPGILVLAMTGGAQATAISVATDMTEGIVARFRTMAISRGAVMLGHVLGNLVQTLGAIAVVIGVAVLIGYRPSGSPLGWLGALGVLVLAGFALIWLSVGMGMAAKSVESASNTPMILTLLPFFGSGFVPTESLPGVLRGFAEVQPFTPFIETVRALLDGTALETGSLVATLAWSVGLTVFGYVWSRWLYDRKSVRS
jgi:ABC-2 type transport system permease protein